LSVGSATTKELPPASTAEVLSPVAAPEGSGFGPSSAKQKTDDPAGISARKTSAASTEVSDRRNARLPGSFVICGPSKSKLRFHLTFSWYASSQSPAKFSQSAKVNRAPG